MLPDEGALFDTPVTHHGQVTTAAERVTRRYDLGTETGNAALFVYCNAARRFHARAAESRLSGRGEHAAPDRLLGLGARDMDRTCNHPSDRAHRRVRARAAEPENGGRRRTVGELPALSARHLVGTVERHDLGLLRW